jgi:hypothetical protein
MKTEPRRADRRYANRGYLFTEPDLAAVTSPRLYELDYDYNRHTLYAAPWQAPEEQLSASGEVAYSGDIAPPRPALRALATEWDDYIEDAVERGSEHLCVSRRVFNLRFARAVHSAARARLIVAERRARATADNLAAQLARIDRIVP